MLAITVLPAGLLGVGDSDFEILLAFLGKEQKTTQLEVGGGGKNCGEQISLEETEG